jgi:hypothetical protein
MPDKNDAEAIRAYAPDPTVLAAWAVGGFLYYSAPLSTSSGQNWMDWLAEPEGAYALVVTTEKMTIDVGYVRYGRTVRCVR